jgi:argininosuccinate synthase
MDIADTREKLAIYTRTGLLGSGSDGGIPLLGGAEPAGDGGN